jgi:hypothetical protein
MRARKRRPKLLFMRPAAARPSTDIQTRSAAGIQWAIRKTMSLRTRVTALCAVLFIAQFRTQAQRNPNIPSPEAQDSLKQFLRTKDEDKQTRYIAAFSDLNGDGIPEAIVYVMGPEWCGSGGCNLLILKRVGTVWKTVTQLTITRPPIRVLKNTSNGWRNIAVWVQGGGIQPGYEAELRFNGKTYPRNPSVPPARPLKKKLPGDVIISPSQNGTPLYEDQDRQKPRETER